nr:beta-aspartyl-peptidase [Phosphitispora fastidiosa]
MFKLILNGELYAPEYLGKSDILMAGEKIALVNNDIGKITGIPEIEEVDATDYFVVPGFIDQHVHIAGGGGEGGPVTRTPEITVSRLTTAGITTVVGLLGADGITRSVAELLAKARALEQEGLSAYIFTGAYEIPTRTLTGSVRSDLVLIDKVLGVGEIAISDHRSSQPTLEMLVKVAAEARIGGLLGKKPGIVHAHIGEGKRGLALLFDLALKTDIPVQQIIPTHVNRIKRLLSDTVELVKLGAFADLTAGIYPENTSPDAVEVCDALAFLMKKGVDIASLTISSDGNGSLPAFDDRGNLTSIRVGSVKVLWEDVRKTVLNETLPLEKALSLITRNPALILGLLPVKGTIAPGSDADIVMLDRDLNIQKVFARGRLMVDRGFPVVRGYFEN